MTQSQSDRCGLPKVSIIIPNWNGWRYLKDCLFSLQAQKYPNYEVIVVDNGSKDNSVNYLKENFPNVNIIKLNKNTGYSRAINSGIEHSEAKYILALNNDATVEPNWLTELIAIAESDERIGSCQPKILSQSDHTKIDSVELAFARNGDACQAGYQTRDKGQYNKVKEVQGASSAAVLYRRQAICQIGMFDPDFLHILKMST